MPRRLSLEIAGLAVIIGLAAWNARLRQAINARPAVEVHTELKTVRISGPVHVVKQIIEKPGAERIVTVTMDRGETTTTREKESDRSEKPACPSSPKLYGGLGIDALDAWQKPYVTGGGFVAETVMLGATINPWRKSVGLQAALLFGR